MSYLNEFRDVCYKMAREKGWHETPRSVGEYIALMHSELSEALEESRSGHEPSEVYFAPNTSGPPKPEGIPIELADVLIRVADFCGAYGIDLNEAVRLKLEFNETRNHRHGGKKL